MALDPIGPSRRLVLRRGAALFALGAAATTASAASAAGTTPKATVKYQYTPNGSNHCSLCTSFIAPPPGAEDGPGACKIVAGPIPQNGWCVLFAPR
jgi:hypothetical protein